LRFVLAHGNEIDDHIRLCAAARALIDAALFGRRIESLDAPIALSFVLRKLQFVRFALLDHIGRAALGRRDDTHALCVAIAP